MDTRELFTVNQFLASTTAVAIGGDRKKLWGVESREMDEKDKVATFRWCLTMQGRQLSFFLLGQLHLLLFASDF